jgi:hypothetical protein
MLQSKLGRAVAAALIMSSIAATADAQQVFQPPMEIDADIAASAGGIVFLSGGSTAMALSNNANSGGQLSFSTFTAGTWSAPATISNALSNDVVLRAQPGGAATLVFTGPDSNAYFSFYSAGAWSTVAAFGSSSPFPNGFSNFVVNALGDDAVIGFGDNFTAARLASGAATWTIEAIPAPVLKAGASKTIDSAAIDAKGNLLVSLHTFEGSCNPACIYSKQKLSSASEGAPGSGWKLSAAGSEALHSGPSIASQVFAAAQGHEGIAYVAPAGSSLALNVVTRTGIKAKWGEPVTLATQSDSSTMFLNLVGVSVSASGQATVVYATGTIGTAGSTIVEVSGIIPGNTWSPPVTLATNVAPNGVHFTSNDAGGVLLAWDNPDAPISVLTRPSSVSSWEPVASVGSPSCGSSTSICTQVLSVALGAGNPNEAILFEDSSSAPGVLYAAFGLAQ